MLHSLGQLAHTLHQSVVARGVATIASGGGDADPVLGDVVIFLGLVGAVPLVWVCAQNVRRFFALRWRGSTWMHTVVRGSGVGLHSEPMPGTLHVRTGRLLWVAEGGGEPVSLAGAFTHGPAEPVGIPRALTFGIIDDPKTIGIALAAGGHAELTVRRPSAGRIRQLIEHPPAGAEPTAPRVGGRPPRARLALTALGVVATLAAGAGTALAMDAPRVQATVIDSWVADNVDRVEWIWDGVSHTDTVDSDGVGEGGRMEVILLPLVDQAVRPGTVEQGSPLLGVVGLIALGAGLVQLAFRRDRVRLARTTLNREYAKVTASSPDVEPAREAEGGNADSAASWPEAVQVEATDPDDAAPPVNPLTMALTHDPIREFLAWRRADEQWGADDEPADPHDWRLARRERLLLPWHFARWGVLVGGPMVGWLLWPFNEPLGTADVVVVSLLVGYLLLTSAAAAQGLRFFARARQLASQPIGTGVRYLLARDWADDDLLILFPTSGDLPPLGVVELQLPAATAISASGSAWLAGAVDAMGRPIDGSLVVPKLSTGPIWPSGHFEVLDDDELRALVAGLMDLDEVDREPDDEGCPTWARLMPTSGSSPLPAPQVNQRSGRPRGRQRRE